MPQQLQRVAAARRRLDNGARRREEGVQLAVHARVVALQPRRAAVDLADPAVLRMPRLAPGRHCHSAENDSNHRNHRKLTV